MCVFAIPSARLAWATAFMSSRDRGPAMRYRPTRNPRISRSTRARSPGSRRIAVRPSAPVAVDPVTMNLYAIPGITSSDGHVQPFPSSVGHSICFNDATSLSTGMPGRIGVYAGRLQDGPIHVRLTGTPTVHPHPRTTTPTTTAPFSKIHPMHAT
jgi:hypothetical protein